MKMQTNLSSGGKYHPSLTRWAFAGTMGALLVTGPASAVTIQAANDAGLYGGPGGSGDASTNYNEADPDGNGRFQLQTSQNEALILDFNLEDGVTDPIADGGGVLELAIGYVSAPPAGSPVSIFELTGGEFDESIVTYNNYVGDATLPVNSVLGGTPVDVKTESELITSNFTYDEFTIPEATLQRMIDGDIAGLAVSAANGGVHVKESFGLPPQLTFEAVPEPASAAMLALGGLALLGRRRRQS